MKGSRLKSGVERRILSASERNAVLVVAVAGIIIAVEEHFHFIDAAIQQSPNALTAGVVILTDLVDQILTVDISQIKIAGGTAAGDIIGADISDRTVGQLDLPPGAAGLFQNSQDRTVRHFSEDRRIGAGSLA